MFVKRIKHIWQFYNEIRALIQALTSGASCWNLKMLQCSRLGTTFLYILIRGKKQRIFLFFLLSLILILLLFLSLFLLLLLSFMLSYLFYRYVVSLLYQFYFLTLLSLFSLFYSSCFSSSYLPTSASWIAFSFRSVSSMVLLYVTKFSWCF